MKKLNIFLAIISALFIVSCSEENVDNNVLYPALTSTEIIAQKLQTHIDENNPELAAAFRFDFENNNWINDNHGTACSGYKIESPFFKVCGVYYNLEYLIKFDQNGSSLNLYFEY